MDLATRLDYWKTVAVEALRIAGRDHDATAMVNCTFRTTDDLFSYFDCFRPNGAGVDKVFAGLSGGDEVLNRLLAVYDSTKESFGRFAYFIVCRPKCVTTSTLSDLAANHLEKVKQIARVVDPEWCRSTLGTMPRIEIVSEPLSRSPIPDPNAPETAICDLMGDWFLSLRPIESDVLLLNEAFYSIACDYELARYLTWPLYSTSTDIVDPFAPYFQLWTHGAEISFKKPDLLTVHVVNER